MWESEAGQAGRRWHPFPVIALLSQIRAPDRPADVILEHGFTEVLHSGVGAMYVLRYRIIVHLKQYLWLTKGDQKPIAQEKNAMKK